MSQQDNVSILRFLLENSKNDGNKVRYAPGELIYSQGEKANAFYFVQKGRIKLSVVSKSGKEAVIGLLEEGSFFGESCVLGHALRLTSAVAMTECEVFSFKKADLLDLLHRNSELFDRFITHLVSRVTRMEEDLVDHLFNSSEKRLARALLLLARYGTDSPPQPIKPKISHETLAEMIGTTRPRVTQFMNKFRKLGFIEYNDSIIVRHSLLTVLLQEDDKL